MSKRKINKLIEKLSEKDKLLLKNIISELSLKDKKIDELRKEIIRRKKSFTELNKKYQEQKELTVDITKEIKKQYPVVMQRKNKKIISFVRYITNSGVPVISEYEFDKIIMK